MDVWERALGGIKYQSGEDFTTMAFNESTCMFIFRSKLIDQIVLWTPWTELSSLAKYFVPLGHYFVFNIVTFEF